MKVQLLFESPHKDFIDKLQSKNSLYLLLTVPLVKCNSAYNFPVSSASDTLFSSEVDSENCFYSEVTVCVENLDVGRLKIIVVVKSSRLVFVLSQGFSCLLVSVSKFLRHGLSRCRHLAWTDGSRQAYVEECLRWCVFVVQPFDANPLASSNAWFSGKNECNFHVTLSPGAIQDFS